MSRSPIIIGDSTWWSPILQLDRRLFLEIADFSWCFEIKVQTPKRGWGLDCRSSVMIGSWKSPGCRSFVMLWNQDGSDRRSFIMIWNQKDLDCPSWYVISRLALYLNIVWSAVIFCLSRSFRPTIRFVPFQAKTPESVKPSDLYLNYPFLSLVQDDTLAFCWRNHTLYSFYPNFAPSGWS